MFSSSIKKELSTKEANHKFKSAHEICIYLRSEARDEDLFDQSMDTIIDAANNFVESFAFNHGLKAHTVTPLVWRFDIKDTHAFEDGLIELRFDNEEQPYFYCIDVSDSKITDSHIPHSTLASKKGYVISFKEQTIKRLSLQLNDWKNQLDKFDEDSRYKLKSMIDLMETRLNQLKSSTSPGPHSLIIECKKLWQKFELAMVKHKTS
jgi:hypothetical protein